MKVTTVRAAYVVGALLGLCSSIPVQAQAPVSMKIDAQPLPDALKALAQQAGIQLLVDADEIPSGAMAPRISGELTAKQALAKMLEKTGLKYEFVNDRTVRIAPAGAAKSSAASDSASLHLARVASAEATDQSSSGEAAAAAAENSPPAADEMVITGSRIRRDPAETGVSPVTVFTRAEIERSGAVTLADFVGRITQAASNITDRESNDLPISGRVTVNLRGLGNNTTLVLLNGRRLPKTAQGFGEDDYNLNGIPLGSIERIEVLTDSASAVYGSDAIGGVINIITRQNYDGMDISVQYGNTFDSDVSEKNADLTFGSNGTFKGDHGYSFIATLGAIDRNSLAASDRPYTALGDYSASGGRPATDNMFAASGGAGSVILLSNPFGAFMAIPAGQDGRNLTPADFLDAGPVIPASAEAAAFRLLLAPSTERTASIHSSLQLSDRVELFAEGSYYEYRSDYEGPPPGSSQILVPAINPFNPFGEDVIVRKVFYELGPSRGFNENSTARFATGLRGGFGGDWRYEAYADHNRSLLNVGNPMPVSINFYPQRVPLPGGGFQEIPTPGSAALRQTDPALALNVFGDGRATVPNDPQLLRSLLGRDEYREKSTNWTGSLQADGTLMRLPAGPLKLAVGSEFRKEQVDFFKLNTIGQYWGSLDDGAKRDVFAAFAEANVPLVRERPGVHALELSLAARLDSESLFGEELTPKAGLLWRPWRSLALRSTYGKGYKTPNLQQLFSPVGSGPSRIFTPPYPVDPVTGEVLDDWITSVSGGNSDLDPEHSVSWNFGFIYEPAALAGFSLSVDYFDIDYRDKVAGSLSFQDAIDYFPERVTRDPVTNLITQIDTRAINLSSASVQGVDVRVVHRIQTENRGRFDASLNYTYNIANKQQSTPGSEVIENVDDSFFPRVRAYAYLFWNQGGFEIGPTVTYESSTANRLPLGAVAPERIRHAVVTDLQGSFDFTGQSFAAGWTEGLKITVGLQNLFDRRPPATDGDGGYAKIDPRQRRFYLSLRKSFD